MDLFKLNNEMCIGYKMLTNADLGIGSSSHQTHIGLSGKVFTYLPNSSVCKESIFIYENICDFSEMFYDHIRNPDGTFRSPKIRIGSKPKYYGQINNSIVNQIRKIVGMEPNNSWYLVYFGLENEMTVFILLKENGTDFEEFRRNGINLISHSNKTLNESNARFIEVNSFIIRFLMSKIDHLAMHIENPLFNGQTRFANHKEVKNKCSEIGRAGEVLVNNYLEFLKKNKRIKKFDWVNKEKESGFPYDVMITTNYEESLFLDVKTTCGKFTSEFFFSDRELNFLSDSTIRNNYRIYRVYDLSYDYSSAKLKIIPGFSNYVDGLKNAKTDFFGVIRGEQNVSIESMVCGFYPKEDLDKSEEILLSNNLNELEIIDSSFLY